MNVTFVNPGVDYMVDRILDFQTEGEVAFWAEPLFFSTHSLIRIMLTACPVQNEKNT
jgi:hypothetical protein